jgi:hypothetical protein
MILNCALKTCLVYNSRYVVEVVRINPESLFKNQILVKKIHIESWLVMRERSHESAP